jgi:hypothetical protein
VQAAYVNLFLIHVGAQYKAIPKENIPTVKFPTAAPPEEALDAEAADPFVQDEYVYLLRVVEPVPLTFPRANMPILLLPAAEPR